MTCDVIYQVVFLLTIERRPPYLIGEKCSRPSAADCMPTSLAWNYSSEPSASRFAGVTYLIANIYDYLSRPGYFVSPLYVPTCDVRINFGLIVCAEGLLDRLNGQAANMT